ncbi:MAG: rRNA maturation RNase YbeY [Candidatus Marinimicrobia bacterium]|nr:rRNA maturation RNase YbeY [Candidatus Neomarinimicrobiota bacterium]
MILIEVEATADDPPLPPVLVQRLVTEVFSDHRVDAAQVTVIFSHDEHLRELKRAFLHLDAYTDVIAFELNDSGEPLEAEIYISVDRAAENSVTYNQTLERELCRLVIHGSLHLMGHADASMEEQSRMRTEEERFLSAITPTA